MVHWFSPIDNWMGMQARAPRWRAVITSYSIHYTKLYEIREEQLFLKYQPVVSSETQTVSGLEALVCWNHSQRGEIDEEEFAQIVEGSSLMVEVGEWTIKQACLEASQS